MGYGSEFLDFDGSLRRMRRVREESMRDSEPSYFVKKPSISELKKECNVKGNMTAIIKPTNACNLACKYCSAESGKSKGTMSSKTLKNSLTKLAKFNGNTDEGKNNETSLVWHGGEPLMMGRRFYRKAMRIQEKLKDEGYVFKNNIQTNGTLLDKRWVDFLYENDF
jgi:sulfatase maturation enzyme AslB (radical SAM superfamily)